MDVPLFCGVYFHRDLLLIPGLCPFCLGNKKQSPQSRFRHYTNNRDLFRHVQKHFALSDSDTQFICPHPKCQSFHPGRDALEHHFETIHFISPAKVNGTAEKRNLDFVENKKEIKDDPMENIDPRLYNMPFIPGSEENLMPFESH